MACHRSAVERVIRTSAERMSEELSLEEMAEIALMSPYHFLRTFRRLTGIPPSRWIEIPRDGDFYVFAAGLARIEKSLDYLMCGGSIRGVAQAGPLTVRDGNVAGDTTLVFRPPTLLDPPLLVTLPLLIDERLAEQLAAAPAETTAV